MQGNVRRRLRRAAIVAAVSDSMNTTVIPGPTITSADPTAPIASSNATTISKKQRYDCRPAMPDFSP
jgi:hypothetical protein